MRKHLPKDKYNSGLTDDSFKNYFSGCRPLDVERISMRIWFGWGVGDGFLIGDDDVIKWKHFPRYWTFVQGIFRWPAHTKASDAELWCFLWSAPEPTLEQTMETPVIWDAIVRIMTSLLWWKFGIKLSNSQVLDRRQGNIKSMIVQFSNHAYG